MHSWHVVAFPDIFSSNHRLRHLTLAGLNAALRYVRELLTIRLESRLSENPGGHLKRIVCQSCSAESFILYEARRIGLQRHFEAACFHGCTAGKRIQRLTLRLITKGFLVHEDLVSSRENGRADAATAWGTNATEIPESRAATGLASSVRSLCVRAALAGRTVF